MLHGEAHEELNDISMALNAEADFFSDDDVNEVGRDMSNVKLNQATPKKFQTKNVLLVTPPFNTKLAALQAVENDPVMLLRTFYNRFFPYKTYFNWLNYDTQPTKNFTQREFSFTLASDTYLRYNSYADVDDLRSDIERLQPVKIDIGAIYNAKPKDKKTINPKAFQPVEKELVFDIDMTDYDEIRTCCSGGDICLKCWGFMTVSIKIIHAALRGRRGVHCWVCDESARKLNNEARSAIVSYLEVIKAKMARKVKLPATLHPSLTRSLDILKNYFVRLVVEDQGILDDEKNWKKVLAIIPDKAIQEKLHERWEGVDASGISRWEDLKKELEKNEYARRKTGDRLNLLPRDIVFQYSYPRLDDKVSTNINHLLKSPFCVHPKTQRVCVPIDPDNCDNFDPFSVPTLQNLCKELDEYNAANGNASDKRIAGLLNGYYDKTSLKAYIQVFEKFVDGLLKEVMEHKRAEASLSMEF
ncbi:p48 polypeptide of DNA primase [Umbelopsis nana]